MKYRFIPACACIAAMFAAAPAARAAAEPDSRSTQQSRFSACAHESKGLRGDDHQAFMSDCLKGNESEASEVKKEAATHRASGEPSAQQSRMKSCNDEAGRKALHGEERRAFMSSCLKG
jgi:hypothetical protein